MVRCDLIGILIQRLHLCSIYNKLHKKIKRCLEDLENLCSTRFKKSQQHLLLTVAMVTEERERIQHQIPQMSNIITNQQVLLEDQSAM